MDPIREGTQTLTDGRMLRWAQWGVPGGAPILLFHGNPGSRLYRFDADVLSELGVQLTTVDRPGIGGSTPRPNRRFVDWPEDVLQLIDALHLEAVGIYGHSMGGPHALACGARLPDRVTRIAISGSPGPWDDPAFNAPPPTQIQAVRELFADQARRDAEAEYRGQLETQRSVLMHDLDKPLSQLSEPDQRLLSEPAHREMASEEIREAVHGGIEGFFEERMAGYVDSWGFELDEVAVHVFVFHGAEDVWVPPQVGRELARRLPNATYHEFAEVGHFLAAQQQSLVLEALLDAHVGQ